MPIKTSNGTARANLTVFDTIILDPTLGQRRERGIQGLWGRIRSDIQAREENYRFG